MGGLGEARQKGPEQVKDALQGLGEVAVTWVRMASGQEDREQ